MLAEGYRNIYENAVKENALYELSTIQKSMDYFGKYGYAVIDSYNQLDMVQSIKVDDFLKKAEKRRMENYYISSYSRGLFYPV